MEIKKIQNTEVITGWIRNQLARFGFFVNLYHHIEVDEDEVYGIYSGESNLESAPTEIKVIAPRILWTVTDEQFLSSFESSSIYTEASIQNGDVIELIREDNKTFRYKVVQIEAIGFEAIAITRFNITPLGD